MAAPSQFSESAANLRRWIRFAAGLGAALALLACSQDSATGAAGGGAADVFRVGAQVVLQQPTDGHVFLAGGTVESNASIGRDATAAAGQVAIRATVGGDLTAAGGQIEVDALVAGQARLAGGSVTILPESRIEGSIAVAGGTLRLAGRFKRDLRVMGGDVTLGGDIGGNVRVYAGHLTVLPGTRIGGTLVYRAANAVQLPPDVQIGGAWSARPERGGERGWHVRPGGWLTALALLVGLLLLVLWLVLVRVSKSTTAALAGRPWFGLWVGFAALVAVPSLALFLALTLVGFPLAIALLLLYGAALAVAYVIGVFYLGDRALAGAISGQRAAKTPLRLLAFLLVLAALALVGALPLIGGLAQFVVLLLGLGGMALALWPGPAGGASA